MADIEVRDLLRKLAASEASDPDLVREIVEAANALGVRQKRDPVWLECQFINPWRRALAGPYSSVTFGRTGSVEVHGHAVLDKAGLVWRRGEDRVAFEDVTLVSRLPEIQSFRRLRRVKEKVVAGDLGYATQLLRLVDGSAAPPLWARFAGLVRGPFDSVGGGATRRI